MHSPIQIKNFNLSVPHKTCFENFSTQVLFGERFAVIGRNGCGKSSLLKMIIENDFAASIAYIPQIINEFDSLSGGQRFNKSLSQALKQQPSMLLLDEPTNHLDLNNRKSLMHMLALYHGTLVIATHDKELIRSCLQTLWHIDSGKVNVFCGNYDDYIKEMRSKRQSILHQIDLLKKSRKSIHQSLMKEQERTAKHKSIGKKKVENKKWMKSVGNTKAMQAEKSQGNKFKAINDKNKEMLTQLSEIRIPETILPKFYLSHKDTSNKILMSITDGSVGYKDKTILTNINFSIMAKEHIAIVGDNGAGKTTLFNAILSKANVVKSGNWLIPDIKDIGYLDQHYGNLESHKSVFDIITETNILWPHTEIRKHLNDFLFRKNEEINTLVQNLSGGEKARLSLAKIAANPPKLLLLDEITNNIDLETRDHLIEILREYPAAMILISHDLDFLTELNIDQTIHLTSHTTSYSYTSYK
ncbi:MAG: ATP-binding cassette domain-containing protein [Holosporales bacterium]|jgi:ATPase subunit of ABC transporter with duplicated ATPase domains|nr:ATP-binding cassette domain-containing protein [Holosporales bacterium]